MTEPKAPITVRARKTSTNSYELHVPGRDGSLPLEMWAYPPNGRENPRWYRYLYFWHLWPDSPLDDWSEPLKSFRRVGDAKEFVKELAEWAAAIESEGGVS